MKSGPTTLMYPELIFGLSGPIGIDIDTLTRTLSDVLKMVGYRSSLIRTTDETSAVPSSINKPLVDTFYNMMRYKMAHSSAICREKLDPAYLMRLVLTAIKRQRLTLAESPQWFPTDDDNIESVGGQIATNQVSPFDALNPQDQKIAFRSAFIIRQIKRPDEVDLLRGIYGDQFILISAYGSQSDRIDILKDRIKRDNASRPNPTREDFLARKLVELDMSEDHDEFGQRTRDAFHLADVVVDGIDKSRMEKDITRFINVLFGLNDAAPTKAEVGMYAAAAASLRSSDLSRQVGAAIYSSDGDVLTEGCNEVPRAFGGIYWDGESPDHRDVKIGTDSNDILKIDVLSDLLDRLKKSGLLSSKVNSFGSTSQIVSFLVGRGHGDAEIESIRGVLKGAKLMDLTEYGRVVHAEMNAICTAARLGISIKDGYLYTTTFPCHNCTKHIIASGIRGVFYLEPYPKSKAEELHKNEIAVEGPSNERVNFRPFIGITPRRYDDVFRKSKRKKDGKAVKWQYGGPAPMIDVLTDDYVRVEGLYTVEATDGSGGGNA